MVSRYGVFTYLGYIKGVKVQISGTNNLYTKPYSLYKHFTLAASELKCGIRAQINWENRFSIRLNP